MSSYRLTRQIDHRMASIAPSSTSTDPRQRLRASAIESTLSALILAGFAFALVLGWLNRGDDWVNPERGLGYALGIAGGSMMLILLAYPIRKRLRGPRARTMGSVGFWFRFHMILGLMGPLAILYHSRFSWGALNSAVALGAMLIVAGSGLIGRFLYSRVHRGYSGRKLELRSLKDEMDALLAELSYAQEGYAGWDVLREFEGKAISAGAGFWSSAAAVVGLGFATRRAERKCRKALLGLAADPDRNLQLRAQLSEFFESVRRSAEFAFYDRLLRLWHLLHLPLFILLVASAILHIVAVHMY